MLRSDKFSSYVQLNLSNCAYDTTKWKHLPCNIFHSCPSSLCNMNTYKKLIPGTRARCNAPKHSQKFTSSARRSPEPRASCPSSLRDYVASHSLFSHIYISRSICYSLSPLYDLYNTNSLLRTDTNRNGRPTLTSAASHVAKMALELATWHPRPSRRVHLQYLRSSV